MSARQVRNNRPGVFGKRYGAVLLAHTGDPGPRATVYNSFPLNDCPQELWSALDAKAVAVETVLPQHYSTAHGTG